VYIGLAWAALNPSPNPAVAMSTLRRAVLVHIGMVFPRVSMGRPIQSCPEFLDAKIMPDPNPLHSLDSRRQSAAVCKIG